VRKEINKCDIKKRTESGSRKYSYHFKLEKPIKNGKD